MAALACGVVGCPGGDGDQALVVVAIKADGKLTVADVAVTIAGASKTFAVSGLSTTATKVGFYTAATGAQAVSVRAPSSGCPAWQGSATTSIAAGQTVPVDVFVQPLPNCSDNPPDGGTAGTGGGAPAGGAGGTGGTPLAGNGAGGSVAGNGGGGAIAGGRDGGSPDMAPPPPATPPSLTKCVEYEHAPTTKCQPDAMPPKYDWAIWNVAFSPDGALFVAGGEDGRVTLWDASIASGLKLNGKAITGNGTAHVAYSNDGTKLAAGFWSGSLNLYNMPAGTLATAVTGHTDDLYEVAFSNDDAVLASVDGAKVLSAWSVAGKRVLATFTLASSLYTVAVLPGGAPASRWIAAGTTTGDLVLADAMAPNVAPKVIHLGDNLYVQAFAVSPDGRTLAIGTDDGTVTLWDITSPGAPKPPAKPLVSSTTTYPQGINGLAYSPSGKHIAVAAGTNNNGGAVRIYDAATGALVGENVPTWYPLSVAWAPDGRGLAAGEVGCGIVLYCRD